MSIWTAPGDIIDFLRPATDDIVDEEEKGGKGEKGGAPGWRWRMRMREGRGRGREKWSSRAWSVDRLGPFFTPRHILLLFLYYIIFFISTLISTRSIPSPPVVRRSHPSLFLPIRSKSRPITLLLSRHPSGETWGWPARTTSDLVRPPNVTRSIPTIARKSPFVTIT